MERSSRVLCDVKSCKETMMKPSRKIKELKEVEERLPQLEKEIKELKNERKELKEKPKMMSFLRRSFSLSINSSTSLRRWWMQVSSLLSPNQESFSST